MKAYPVGSFRRWKLGFQTGVSDGGNWGFKLEFPTVETGVGNRGWKQGLETGVSNAGNSSCRRWKLEFPSVETRFICVLPLFWHRVAVAGNWSFRRWKLEFPTVETGVSDGGNWGFKLESPTVETGVGNRGWKLEFPTVETGVRNCVSCII